MELYANKKWPLFTVLAICSLLCFTRLAIVSFLVFLIILGTAISGYRKNWLRQGLWAYLFFFCFLVIFSSIAAIANIGVNFIAPLFVFAAFTWIAVIALPIKRTKTPPGRDWAGLAAASAVCLYLCIPLLLRPSAATVLRYSAKTSDDTSNIARVEAIRSEGGLLYKKQARISQIIDPGTAVSPQGWHVNGAFAETLIIKLAGSDTISVRLVSYLIYKVAWLFIATTFLFLLIQKLLLVFFRLSGTFFDVLSAIGAGITALVFLITLYGYGFQDFVASIALVCASLLLAFGYIDSTGFRRQKIYLFGLLVLSIVSIYVWSLAGAIVGLVTLAVAAKEVLANYKLLVSWRHWLLAAAFASLAALPVFYLLKHGSQRGLSTINSSGAVPPIKILAVILFFIITAAVIKKLRPKHEGWLLSLTGLSALEFFVLAAYQQAALGQQRYYAIKLAFLVAVVTSIIFLSAIIRILGPSKLPRIFTTVFVILIAVLIPLALGMDLRKSAYPLKGGVPISQTTANKILSLPPSDRNAVIYGSTKGESFLATKLWSSVNLYNSPQRKALLEKMSQAVHE